MEKRVYKENPLKVAVNVVIGIGIFVLVVMPLATYIRTGGSASWDEYAGGIIALSPAVALMLITLLSIWLATKKRSVTVDLVGCEIVAKRPFGQPEVERFQWKDVSAVFITSESYTIKNSTQTNYKFSVFADGRVIYLMDKTFLNKTLKNLVADVGAATKHLGYVWEECRADETRPILEVVPPFCKVALNNAIIFAS